MIKRKKQIGSGQLTDREYGSFKNILKGENLETTGIKIDQILKNNKNKYKGQLTEKELIRLLRATETK